ncbi:MAG: hypothetical protein ABJK11_03640 [Balneola sp.]
MVTNDDTIQSIEEELFKDWEQRHSSFVKDGIVSESDYLSSNKKVLLILKEVNFKRGESWDLRKYITDKPRGKTWNIVSFWIKGIQNLDKSFDWKSLKKIKKSERAEFLKSIVVINLKKTAGGGSSNRKEIKRFAQNDHKYLIQQFNLYKPDIVICCGTGNIVKEINLCGLFEWKRTNRGIKYGEFDKGRFVYSFYHPQARYPNHFKYYMLIDAIKESINID